MISKRPLIAWLVMGGVNLALIALVAWTMPFGIDWHLTFRPAALAVWAGQSPYTVDIFGLAPWGILPFLPFALLPENLGRACLFVLSLGVFGWAAYRLGAKPLVLGAFLLSPPVLNDLLNTNANWLVLLGFTLPPQIGLFFITIKPQVGAGVAVFWLVEAWRKGGWREVARVFGPLAIALGASFLVFGFWPMRSVYVFTSSQTWNASLWPASVPVGLVLLVSALRQRKIRYAFGVAPCLSPYVLFHAWSGALLALAPAQAEMLVAVAGLWAVVIIRALGP